MAGFIGYIVNIVIHRIHSAGWDHSGSVDGNGCAGVLLTCIEAPLGGIPEQIL